MFACAAVSFSFPSPQQARAEQEEEFISNTLFKKIQALQKEKETLAVNYEKEEEFLTNELSRKLMHVSGNKIVDVVVNIGHNRGNGLNPYTITNRVDIKYHCGTEMLFLMLHYAKFVATALSSMFSISLLYVYIYGNHPMFECTAASALSSTVPVLA